MVNKGFKYHKKDKYLRFKKYERKNKSSFMIYTDFENIFVPKDKWMQNLNEAYTNKYQKILLAVMAKIMLK